MDKRSERRIIHRVRRNEIINVTEESGARRASKWSTGALHAYKKV